MSCIRALILSTLQGAAHTSGSRSVRLALSAQPAEGGGVQHTSVALQLIPGFIIV